jgi:hypothetical protein
MLLPRLSHKGVLILATVAASPYAQLAAGARAEMPAGRAYAYLITDDGIVGRRYSGCSAADHLMKFIVNWGLVRHDRVLVT